MDQKLSEEMRRRLTGLRGSDLVEALADEIVRLHTDLHDLRRDMEALEQYSLLTKRLELVTGPLGDRTDLPRQVEVSAMEHLLPRDGFYALEYAQDGTAFRWTGPERTFSFNIFIDRRAPLLLTLEALNAAELSLMRNIEIFVDGLPHDRQVQPLGDGFRLVANLEPREGAEATHLNFIVPSVSVPAASEDRRVLGVAFTRLSLKPIDPPKASKKNKTRRKTS